MREPDRNEGPHGGTSTATRRTATRFNGLIALLLLIALPPLVYYLWICLEYFGGRLTVPTADFVRYFPWPTPVSVEVAAGWLLFQGLLQTYSPGRWIEGVPLVDGSRLPYRMNGWFSWWFTWGCLAGGLAAGWIRPTLLADEFGPLLTTMNLFAYAFSFLLYWHGRTRGTDPERGIDRISDFWLGTVLNPRNGNLDLKLFCEARPGLIGWIAIDLSLAAKQYALFGHVTSSMLLVCAFQFWYVADYYFHEEAILTCGTSSTKISDSCFAGETSSWVPFTYTIQASYLMTHPHELGGLAIAGLVLLNGAGYVIFFGGTNIQKHRFRKNPNRPVWGRPAEYIETARGSLLLTSGWWGLARHMIISATS